MEQAVPEFRRFPAPMVFLGQAVPEIQDLIINCYAIIFLLPFVFHPILMQP